MPSLKLYVPNISCQHCIRTITRELSALSGVASVNGDPGTKMVTVEFQPPASEKEIRNTLIEIGYPAEGAAAVER